MIVTLRVGAGGPTLVAGMAGHLTRVVANHTDLDPAADQFGSGRLDVGHDEGETLNRSRRGPCDPPAEDDCAFRARRSQLDHSEVITDDEVGLVSKSRCQVEVL